MRFIESGDFDYKSYKKGLCMSCGSPKKDGDTGVIELLTDRWGHYDICMSCAQELGSMTGMMPEDKADAMRKRNRKYGTDLKAANERVADLEKILSSYLGPDK